MHLGNDERVVWGEAHLLLVLDRRDGGDALRVGAAPRRALVVAAPVHAVRSLALQGANLRQVHLIALRVGLELHVGEAGGELLVGQVGERAHTERVAVALGVVRVDVVQVRGENVAAALVFALAIISLAVRDPPGVEVPRLEVGGGHGQGDRGQRRAECSLHHRCCTRGQGAVSGVGVHSTPRRATERMMIRGSHAWGVQGGRCRGWAARVMRGGCKRRWGTGTARTHQFLPCCSYTAPQSQSGALESAGQELVWRVRS